MCLSGLAPSPSSIDQLGLAKMSRMRAGGRPFENTPTPTKVSNQQVWPHKLAPQNAWGWMIDPNFAVPRQHRISMDFFSKLLKSPAEWQQQIL